MKSPYSNLPPSKFWSTAVVQSPYDAVPDLYIPKWKIDKGQQIAIAGSCFAQHLAKYLRKNGAPLLDVEPAPVGLSREEVTSKGYGVYSGRYGNIYTVHQLLQLALEAAGKVSPSDIVWEREGRYIDALRPGVERKGFSDPELVLEARALHIPKVKELFQKADVLIFTMGLTEAWINTEHQTVYPVAPGVIAGEYDPARYHFKNFSFREIFDAFYELRKVVQEMRQGRAEIRYLLTVSPVALTATASSQNALQANIYSKSVLRSVAGELAQEPQVDYFPGYEIVLNPATKTRYYCDNLRNVTLEGVHDVMKVFFAKHNLNQDSTADTGIVQLTIPDVEDLEDTLCEEELLEAFSSQSSRSYVSSPDRKKPTILFVGDSHLAAVKKCIEIYYSNFADSINFAFAPVSWMQIPWSSFEGNKYLTDIAFKEKYKNLVQDISINAVSGPTFLCFVGLGALGNGLVNQFGTLKAGSARIKDGKSISPELPCFSEAMSEYKYDAVKNSALADQLALTYSKLKQGMDTIYAILQQSSHFKRVLWLAAPDMTETAGRFRFGDHYVEQYNHCLHVDIAQRCCKDILHKPALNESGFLITHSQDFRSEYGFTKDIYRARSEPWDVHTSPEFNIDAINQLLEAILNSPLYSVEMPATRA
jgi:hypothetical protein